jgi:hypothetical protein
MPMWFWSIKGSALAAEVAKNLRFGRRIRVAARKVLAGISKHAGQDIPHHLPVSTLQWHYNGIHLRLEKDASSWWERWGGMDGLRQAYLQECDKAAMNTSMPLYIASGLFTYDARKNTETIESMLGPYGKVLRGKHDFIPAPELDALDSEQLAAIDFLVIAHAQVFVGNEKSTFSWYLREFRHLRGIANRNSSCLVDCNDSKWLDLVKMVATFDT